MSTNYYQNGTEYTILNCFYNNQEIDRIYKGDNLIYRWEWSKHIILPTLWGDDEYEIDPPFTIPGYYDIFPYDDYIAEHPEEMEDPDFYPLENWLNWLNNEIEEGYIYSYNIIEPNNNLIEICEYPDEIVNNMNLTDWMYNLYYYTQKVEVINSLDNIVELDDDKEPIEYYWLKNLVNDSNNNIFVHMIMPYGNYDYYIYNYESDTDEIVPFYGYLGQSESNIYPLYFYCENSQNLYYNQNAFYNNFEEYYYKPYLGKDDLSLAPGYDYVKDCVSVYTNTNFINANFNSLLNIDNTLFNTRDGYFLEKPLYTPYVINMNSSYENAIFLKKAYCGKYTTDLSYAYYNCIGLKGKAACEDNVIYMRSTYHNCVNLSKAVCEDNVIDMTSAYGYCINITGKAACGDNVIYMDSAYSHCERLSYPNIGPNVINSTCAFYYCNNLKQIEIPPQLQNANAMYMGVYKVENIYINRFDSNLNIIGVLTGSNASGNYYPFCKNIIIEGNLNFQTFTRGWMNGYANLFNQYGRDSVFRNLISLEKLYISNGLKEIKNFFSGTNEESLSNLTNYYIPESIEVYDSAFKGTGLKQCIHNNYGGLSFRNAYENCYNLSGELYLPETTEDYRNIAYHCYNLESVIFNRNCQIPYFIGSISKSYNFNNHNYNGVYGYPFEECYSVTDLKVSEYMIDFGTESFIQFTNNKQENSDLGTNNFALRNIVLYNNDNMTQKNLYRAFSLNMFPSYDNHYLDIYVPDSTNENSFNYIFYTDKTIFWNYSGVTWNGMDWTEFENGYYNEQYKIRVLNNYDYINDCYR